MHKALKSPTLHVLTGLEDDRRKPIDPDHPLHGLALHAHNHQDEWSLREHARFWEAALVVWPRPKGQRPAIDHLAAAAAHLRRHGIEEVSEIADVLGVEPDTIAFRQRDRPSLDRGDELLQPPDLGVTLSRMATGFDRSGEPPLPRVYAAAEDEPEFTFVNPCLELPAGAYLPAPQGPDYTARAERHLRDANGKEMGKSASRQSGFQRVPAE